jgi:hypothetical protein
MSVPRFRFNLWLILSGLALIAALSAAPQAVLAQDDEELPEYRAGLVATYSAEGSAQHKRIDPLLAFVWNERSPDMRLAPDPSKLSGAGGC